MRDIRPRARPSSFQVRVAANTIAVSTLVIRCAWKTLAADICETSQATLAKTMALTHAPNNRQQTVKATSIWLVGPVLSAMTIIIVE